MANFYTEHPELRFHLNNPLMERICELKERSYKDKDEYDYAPQDFADAIDSYDKVLEITGEITGEVIAANAEGVDEEGPHCANGRVEYASGTKANLDAMVKAGLNGMTMPRRYGGLNFPITPYTMCAEIVAQADAGFGNIWSLQDCIETLYEFGNEDQHSRFIPRICAGETRSFLFISGLPATYPGAHLLPARWLQSFLPDQAGNSSESTLRHTSLPRPSSSP